MIFCWLYCTWKAGCRGEQVSSNHQRYPPSQGTAALWRNSQLGPGSRKPLPPGTLLYIFLLCIHTPVEPALAFPPSFFCGPPIYFGCQARRGYILTGICAHWIVNILNLGLIVLLKGFDK